MAIEGQDQTMDMAGPSETDAATKSSKHTRGGNRLGAPLDVQNRKSEFLRRGSPRLRSVISSKQVEADSNEKNEMIMDSEYPVLLQP
ncbi:hypothetical protein DY000_02047399 [Brassica cretica]|uniref:Uncharacterized protein n=1 Tax=Brassica cretica TaxID=69181 RepID=A0ABQ7F2S0_BRACR|nr:hypothetical protein DY000_02047399 [Brassica cretica]